MKKNEKWHIWASLTVIAFALGFLINAEIHIEKNLTRAYEKLKTADFDRVVIIAPSLI